MPSAKLNSLPVCVVLVAFMVCAISVTHAQTLSVLHYFTGQGDGAFASTGLTVDAGGNLYGTAESGGSGYGLVFKLVHRNSGWILTPLYDFQGGSDGADPFAKVIIGPDGALYGTTTSGGGNGNCQCYQQDTSCGVVYKLTPPQTICRSAGCRWTETVLHRFGSGTDGGCPRSSLAFDHAGNMYGSTTQGGTNGRGTIFELSPAGGNWTETVVHDFNGSDGGNPRSEVTLDSFGNLFGTTEQGGQGCFGGGCGVVYELSRNATGWLETVLYSFVGTSDGSGPSGGVVFDSAGNLYGTTYTGPFNSPGMVYVLSPGRTSWRLNPVYVWTASVGDPAATLVMDSAGNLYGTTFEGGDHGVGSVYKLTKSGSSWEFNYLHAFDGSDGTYISAPVALDNAGNIYGTAWQGGQGCAPYGCGTAWEIMP